ncbi:hypothetical protein JCM19297_294 [Nonlabens ulvanivorans]|nr:hypothetical protein [Nonlabens ulvanivorans]GAK89672.1 hypothetical protein JCM19297_294 [Nonlabens ulvanivorans]
MAYQDFASQSSKAKGNNSLRVSHRSILIDLLNIILEIKYNHIINNKLKVENSNSVDYFQNVSVNDYQDLKNDFREVIEFYFAKHDCEYQINKYLTGFADFEYIDGLNSILKTNDEHSLYRKTLDKSKYDETYLTNRVIENSSQILDLKKLPSFWDKEFKLNLLSSIEYYKFLNIPLEISIDSKEIDLKKVLHLLKTFSLLFNPQPTTTFNGIVLHRETPKNFSNLFYSDYIVSYEVSEFVNKCTNYFKWSKEEVKSILNFITTDFSINQNIRVDLKMKPLVKIGNQYFWLSNFMKDIRWEIPLHRKLVADEVLNSQRISDLSEVDLANYFREAKFSAINSHKYYFDEIKGEIDIIAYKDGVLFLCELKSTYVKEDIVRSSLFESRNFNFKASEQLDIAKEYVKNNFHEIKNIKELNVDCTLENLLIETIIVSNVYQSDHLLFNRRHMKVSQLELSIILRNDKHEMLVSKLGTAFFDSKLEIPIDKLMSLHEGNNSNIKEVDGQIQKEDCNLWSHKSYCSPQDLISAIKENKVWRHQDDYKDYHIEEIELGVYNKNYKYLA